MSDDRGGGGASLLLAFLVGAAAGAVVALLTTPKSGPEMRDSFASWARRSGLKDAVSRAARKTQDALDRAGDA